MSTASQSIRIAIARVRRIAVQAVTVVLVLALAALIAHLISSFENFRQTPQETAHWADYQMGREYDRFHIATLAWQPGDDQLEANLRSRFRILAKRVTQIDKHSAAADEVGYDMSAPDDIAKLVADTERLFAASERMTPETIEQLRAEIAAVAPTVNGFLELTLQQVNKLSEARRLDIENTITVSVFVFSGLFLSVVVALFFLVRQRERLRIHGAMMHETARTLADAHRIARIGTFQWDFVADEVRWSDELARIYGLQNGATMKGDQFRQLVHPDDALRVELAEMHAASRSAASGAPEPRDTHYRVIRPDGRIAYVYAAAEILASPLGEPLSMTSTVRDVTEEYEQKRALEESEANLAEAQRIAKLGSFRGNLVTGEIYWSDELYRITGKDQDAVGDRPSMRDIVHPEDLTRVLGNWEKYRQASTPNSKRQVPLEHRVIRADGKLLYLRGTMEYRYGEDGSAVSVAGTLRDVTDERSQEQALQSAKAEAEQANSAKTEFLAVMSHELRTPMNGVIGMLSALEETELNEDQTLLARVARTSADALLMIVNDILDLSKIEAGKLELEQTSFELRPLLRSVVHLYIQQARAKNIILDTEIAEDLPKWFEGDAGRLRQIILNLVSNAVKFTGQGMVLIRAQLLQAKEEGRATVRFSVIDNGLGIAPEKRGEVFSRFNQLDRSYARRFGGTGLGLAISKRLAELMGGSIDFVSEPGVETTFWCDIPLRPIEAQSAGNAVTSNIQMPPQKILVAEDNTTNQLVIQRLLQKMGHQVDVVNNGVEAVEAVASRSYDLVLMDVSMPLLDGIEATRQIRALDGNRSRIRVIALTANTMQEDIDTCLAAGMDDFLSKPIVLQKLEAALSYRTLATISGSETDHPTAGKDDDGSAQLERLSQLESEVGAETMPELLSACVTDLTRTLEELRNALHEGDFKAIGRAAHSMRGVGVTLGASKLSIIAGQAEDACLDDEPDGLVETLAELEASARQVITAADLSKSRYVSVRQH
jgi:PAS domain S-box-containing protein